MKGDYLVGATILILGLIILFQSSRLAVTLLGCFIVFMGALLLGLARQKH